MNDGPLHHTIHIRPLSLNDPSTSLSSATLLDDSEEENCPLFFEFSKLKQFVLKIE